MLTRAVVHSSCCIDRFESPSTKSHISIAAPMATPPLSIGIVVLTAARTLASRVSRTGIPPLHTFSLQPTI